MIGSLRLLIVEEDEDKALSIVRQLQRSHFGVDARRVETPEELSRQLAEREWDLVIAALGLAHFNGLEAVRLVRSHSAELPLIVMSSPIDLESGRAAAGAGVECVLREETGRLVPLIERLLRDAERRRSSLGSAVTPA